MCHQKDRVEVGEDKNISGSSRRCNVIIGGVDDSGAGGTREKPFPCLKFGAKPSKLPPEKYLPHKSHPWIVDSGCLDCISRLPEWTAVDSLGQSPDNPQTLHQTPHLCSMHQAVCRCRELGQMKYLLPKGGSCRFSLRLLCPQAGLPVSEPVS